MRRRVLTPFVISAALVLSACGGGSAEPAPAASSTSAAPATVSPTTPGEVKRADGLALLVEPKTGVPSVQVFDWNTGRVLQNLPFQLTDGGFGPAVSPDLRYAVRKGGYGSVEVYKADAERGYTLAATVQEPTEGYGTGKVEYGDHPRFNPKDGRVWMTAGPAKGDPYFVSFDPANPKQQPRRERTRKAGLASFSPWGFDRTGELWERSSSDGNPAGTITVGGKRSYKLRYWTGVAGSIVDARLKFDYSLAYGEPEYTMLDRLGPTTLLLRSTSVLKDDSTGEIMQVDLNLKQRSASYRPVVPASADSVLFDAVYPDRRHVLIATENAWYRVALGNASGQPERLPDAPAHSLGETTQIP